MILLTNAASRPAADEDGQSDHIGYDTPRSGIATPQPDLHDKRTPGIMSYFGQVGSTCSGYLSRPLSFTRTPETGPSRPASSSSGEKEAGQVPQQLPSPEEMNLSKDSVPEALPLLPHERIEPPAESESRNISQPASCLHPYPTPPCSKRPSVRESKPGASSSDVDEAATTAGAISLRRLSSTPTTGPSELSQMKSRRGTFASPLTSIVTASSVHANHLSNPSEHSSTAPRSPLESQVTSGEPGNHSPKSASIGRLRKLTLAGCEKSDPSTPTRAMSSTHQSQTEGQSSPSKHQSESTSTEASGRGTPVSRSGSAQGLGQKGKLTIKILEAKGLRKCRDPYVVVVFQRSELISSGPRTFDDEDELMPPTPASGGVPIQRQGSDSGRPMAIPMRSRQSSNTSVTDYNTFRSRNPRRSFTNPKWDAEAVL